jgi:hypothetical protein
MNAKRGTRGLDSVIQTSRGYFGRHTSGEEKQRAKFVMTEDDERRKAATVYQCTSTAPRSLPKKPIREKETRKHLPLSMLNGA